MAAEALRAAVFFEDEEERRLAEEALDAKPGETRIFNGVVEGWAAPARLEELSRRGMVVEPLSEGPVPGSGAEGRAPARELLADFEQQASLEPAEPVDEAVYRLDLDGPITKEQRLELDSFGVDIYMFEPPSRYRTFLTPEQLEKVSELPYVNAVTPYGFGESVTPALLDTVSEAQQGKQPTQTFDCLLHRASDLERIRSLIDAAEGTSVVGTSNLRVRFESPVDAPFLAGLAALPEVRKLAPFHPPKLL